MARQSGVLFGWPEKNDAAVFLGPTDMSLLLACFGTGFLSFSFLILFGFAIVIDDWLTDRVGFTVSNTTFTDWASHWNQPSFFRI